MVYILTYRKKKEKLYGREFRTKKSASDFLKNVKRLLILQEKTKTNYGIPEREVKRLKSIIIIRR